MEINPDIIEIDKQIKKIDEDLIKLREAEEKSDMDKMMDGMNNPNDDDFGIGISATKRF